MVRVLVPLHLSTHRLLNAATGALGRNTLQGVSDATAAMHGCSSRAIPCTTATRRTTDQPIAEEMSRARRPHQSNRGRPNWHRCTGTSWQVPDNDDKNPSCNASPLQPARNRHGRIARNLCRVEARRQHAWRQPNSCAQRTSVTHAFAVDSMHTLADGLVRHKTDRAAV